METWFLFISGQQAGPFTFEQIADMARADELPADAMAFDQAGGQWQPLSGVPALAALAPVAYFCHRNNEQLGPFTAAQIKTQLAAGKLAATDLVFIAAVNDWQPLQTSPLWPKISPAPTAPVAPAAENPTPPATKAAIAIENTNDRTEEPTESAPAKTATATPADIQFPCKNHPDRDSLLICRACGADFCGECLVEIAGTRYCKECQAAGKAAPAEKKAGKLLGRVFGK